MSLGNRHSQHSFAQIPNVHMARSSFNRSFAVKDTMNFDYLNPFFVEEILPGDTINLNVKAFCRLAPQVVPLLDNMYLDFFFFFVPNRLVWENWERFNGAQDDPNSSIDFLIPTVDASTVSGGHVGTIYDKFGIPYVLKNTPAGNSLPVNALPFRAYNLIHNEWFRDQNLQNSLDINFGDGPDNPISYTLRLRNKVHDYFTSCLPWPQKGDPVTLPLGSVAPVTGTLDFTGPQTNTNNTITFGRSGTNFGSLSVLSDVGQNANVRFGAGGGDGTLDTYAVTNGMGFSVDVQAKGPLVADLSEATAATINQFRQAIMMQSLLELDARGGTRYVEILKAHFNVISPDFRLQRPELLSIGQTKIMQHVVAQTSSTVEDSPLGNVAAFSTASLGGNRVGFSKSFVEHGYVIGLVQARADITYQQGLNRMWSRQTRFDFFWPKLQELGEQAVLNKEIYAQGTSVPGDPDNGVFGYQERYAEYRYRPSEIRGYFKSGIDESLDVWHLAEEFESLPALNGTFIKSSTPIERSLVVPDASYPDLLCDFWFDMKHARPIMAYGVPASLGRF